MTSPPPLSLSRTRTASCCGRCSAQHGDGRGTWLRVRRLSSLATGGAGRTALSGLPDLEPLWRDGGRSGAGLSCGREAAVSGHSAIPSDRCCIPERRSYGALVTEKVRSLGAKAYQPRGRRRSCIRWRRATLRLRRSFASARPTAIWRVDAPNGKAVWLDTPMIDKINGEGTLKSVVCPRCCACI